MIKEQIDMELAIKLSFREKSLFKVNSAVRKIPLTNGPDVGIKLKLPSKLGKD